jgi:hypothetical protein
MLKFHLNHAAQAMRQHHLGANAKHMSQLVKIVTNPKNAGNNQ